MRSLEYNYNMEYMYPCLSYKGCTKDIADFYINVFGDGHIVSLHPQVTMFELSKQLFMVLDGCDSTPSPATSICVVMESIESMDRVWKELSNGGEVLIPLDKYPCAEYFGWVQDKYGFGWVLVKKDPKGQKFITSFVFCNEQKGKTQEAVEFYTKLFPNSEIEELLKYEEGPDKGLVSGVLFNLNGVTYRAMDSSDNKFSFNHSISNVVECKTQEEIDYLWDGLTKGGIEGECGWCCDRYGIWWQIVPVVLGTIMSDPVKAPKAVDAFMKMKKFDIKTLLQAVEA